MPDSQERPERAWLRERKFLELKNLIPILFMLLFSMAALNLSARLLGEERRAMETYRAYSFALLTLKDSFFSLKANTMASMALPSEVDSSAVQEEFNGLVSSFEEFLQMSPASFSVPGAMPVVRDVQDEFVLLGTLLENYRQTRSEETARRIWAGMSALGEQIDKLIAMGTTNDYALDQQAKQKVRHSQITWSVFVMGLSGFVLIVVLIDKLSTLRQLDTEKRRTLHVLEQRLAAMSAAFDGISITDRDGTILYANNALVSFYGYDDVAELVGKSWKILYDDAQVQWFVNEVSPIVEAEGQWHGHTKGRKKDGSSFFLDISLTSLPDGGRVGVMRDVTELIRMEALSRRRLAAIEAAGDGIGIYDENGNITFVNKALLGLHGISEEKAWACKGKYWTELYDPQTARVMKEEILPYLREQGYWRGERKVQKRTGEHIWVEISLTVLPEGGFISTSVDVSERKLAEEERVILQQQFYQAQKMEAVGRLAGGIAHDFNNVLAAIMGYAEFLYEDLESDPPKRKHAANILQAGGQARHLVDQMLQFSRRKESAKTNVDIAEVLNDVLDIVQASFPKSIEVRTDFAINSAKTLGNQTQLAQILMNLCVNARDAMEDKRGILTLGFDEIEADPDLFEEMIAQNEEEARKAEHLRIYDPEPGRTYLELGRMVEGQTYAVLSVADTGSGVSRTIMEHIFEPFFTTKPVEKGTGLGLSNVHGILLGHGGALTIDSRVGQGTRFDIYLPLVTVDGEEEQSSPSVDEYAGTGKILVVEDQITVREMLATMLERLGYECAVAATGLEALSVLRETDGGFDLVVTDHNMPRMTGVELAEQARIGWPNLPVVLISGYSTEAIGDIDNIESIKAIIRKPVSKQEMASVLRSILGPVSDA